MLTKHLLDLANQHAVFDYWRLICMVISNFAALNRHQQALRSSLTPPVRCAVFHFMCLRNRRRGVARKKSASRALHGRELTVARSSPSSALRRRELIAVARPSPSHAARGRTFLAVASSTPQVQSFAQNRFGH